MATLALSAYLNSKFGVEEILPRAGSALENPFVFDATAQELKAMAAHGRLEIVEEHRTKLADESLIDRLSFKRLR